jgi:hypothetical protein
LRLGREGRGLLVLRKLWRLGVGVVEAIHILRER